MLASITILCADGVSYAANVVQVRSKGWGEDYKLLVVAFECSGVLKVVDAQDVVSITYNFRPAEVPA